MVYVQYCEDTANINSTNLRLRSNTSSSISEKRSYYKFIIKAKARNCKLTSKEEALLKKMGWCVPLTILALSNHKNVYEHFSFLYKIYVKSNYSVTRIKN